MAGSSRTARDTSADRHHRVFLSKRRGGGLWQGGVGLTADASGNIYLETMAPSISTPAAGIIAIACFKISTGNGGSSVIDYFTPHPVERSTSGLGPRQQPLNSWHISWYGRRQGWQGLHLQCRKPGSFQQFSGPELSGMAGDIRLCTRSARWSFWGGNYIFTIQPFTASENETR